MAEVEKALKRVRAAAAKLSSLQDQHAAAKDERDAALRAAQDARATWKEMLEASGISQPTLAKALRRQ